MMNARTYSLLGRCLRLRCQYSSSIFYGPQDPAPLLVAPLLVKIRSDLKSAMKNRDNDRNRLNVIRAILADANHFSHEAFYHGPIENDSQVLALLKKRLELSKGAAAEFRAAKRDDLADVEESQIAVLQEYINFVPVASDEEIRRLVADAIEIKTGLEDRLSIGIVTEEVLEKLNGKQIEMALVTKAIRDMVNDHRKSLEDEGLVSQQI